MQVVPATITVTGEPPGWVGLCFRLRHLPHAPVGVVVDHAPGALVVLHDGATASVLPPGALAEGAAPPVDVHGHRSSAWKLVALAAAVAGRRVEFDWDQGALHDRGMALASRSDDARRLFTLDALAAARPELVPAVGLPAGETWSVLAAWHADAGRTGEALEALRRVPPGAPVPGTVVTAAARCWARADGPTRAHLEALVRPWAGSEPLADLLLALAEGGVPAAAGGPAPGPAVLARAVSGVLRAVGGTGDADRDQQAAALVEACATGRGPFVSVTGLGPAAALLGATRRRSADAAPDAPAWAAPDLAAEAVAAAPTSVVDDLIAAGFVRAELLDELTALVAPERAIYLMARLAPEQLSDADVAGLGHTDEALRRAAAAGDRDALLAAPASPVRDGLLLAADLRAGRLDDAAATGTRRPPPERAVLELLVARMREGTVTAADDALFADPTTWPFLAVLDGGRLRPHRTVGPARRFVAWRTLCEVRDLLWAGEPAPALARARDLLGWADDDAVRAEACNLAATAHWLRGEDREAMQALLAAVDTRHTEALQVNLGIVAGAVEPELAAEHLAGLALEAPSRALRSEAALRAVSLWQQAVEVGAAPEELPNAVRAALRATVGEAIPLERFRVVVRLLALWDADWVVEHGDLAGSPHRGTPEAQVYVARARGLQAFVAALADALRGADPPVWAQHERDGLVRALLAALHDDDPPAASRACGEAALDVGLALQPDQEALLAALLARARAADLAADALLPLPVAQLLARACSARDALAPPDRERIAPLVDVVVDGAAERALRTGRAWLAGATAAYRDVHEPIRDLPPEQVDRAAVRGQTEHLVTACAQSEETLGVLVRALGHGDRGHGDRGHGDGDRALLVDGLRGKHRELLGLLTRLRGEETAPPAPGTGPEVRA
jgi:hypothetical protein